MTKSKKHSIPKVRSNSPTKDERLRSESRQFIKKYGLLNFLDVCQGTVNKVLVMKGLVTVEELRDAYLTDIMKASVKEACAESALFGKPPARFSASRQGK